MQYCGLSFAAILCDQRSLTAGYLLSLGHFLPRTLILINVRCTRLHTVHGVIQQAQTHAAVTEKQPTFPHILD